MKLTLLLFVFVMISLAQPQFSYQLDAASQAGVAAYTSSHRDFETRLHQMRADRGLEIPESVKPWMLILENTTPQVIASVLILYKHEMSNGVTVTGGVIAKRNPFLGGQMKPGDKFIFVPHNGGVFDRLVPHTAAALAGLSLNTASVRVSIDSISFEDGSIVGPDTGGMAKRFALERQAFAKIRAEYRAAADKAAYVSALSQLLPTAGADGANPFTDLSSPAAVEAEIRRRLGRSLLFAPIESQDRQITEIITGLNRFTRKGELK